MSELIPLDSFDNRTPELENNDVEETNLDFEDDDFDDEYNLVDNLDWFHKEGENV